MSEAMPSDSVTPAPFPLKGEGSYEVAKRS
jgi:hypothetical protein